MMSALCERLGTEIPIIQAPMGGAVGPNLAAAVSTAGGLGTPALWAADIETVRQQVRETCALTGKPFAVNLNLEFPQTVVIASCFLLLAIEFARQLPSDHPLDDRIDLQMGDLLAKCGAVRHATARWPWKSCRSR
jgi:IMP dehydrogenase/GMP reductase